MGDATAVAAAPAVDDDVVRRAGTVVDVGM